MLKIIMETVGIARFKSNQTIFFYLTVSLYNSRGLDHCKKKLITYTDNSTQFLIVVLAVCQIKETFINITGKTV